MKCQGATPWPRPKPCRWRSIKSAAPAATSKADCSALILIALKVARNVSFNRRWAGYATAKEPFRLKQSRCPEPYFRFVQRELRDQPPAASAEPFSCALSWVAGMLVSASAFSPRGPNLLSHGCKPNPEVQQTSDYRSRERFPDTLYHSPEVFDSHHRKRTRRISRPYH